MPDERLMVGYDSSDDAAVYRVSDQLAMIQTVDFFPPVVDDPFDFGRIAAANALSDVYAMGGEPKIAMNLLAVPSCLPLDAVGAILEGGAAKVAEAGAVLAGGHSIEDQEPKYGLCVTGFASPDRILTNSGARVGDLLVLTKPLGTGILTTAAKAQLLEEAEYREMVEVMATLNRRAAQAAVAAGASACTDITGFGLLGHGKELAQGSGCTIRLWAGQIPVLGRTLEMARDGIIPAGAYRNREFAQKDVDMAPGVAREVADVLYDPQTAGGLLIAVPEAAGRDLIRRLTDEGVTAAAIGTVLPPDSHLVQVRE
jgi:selenide,water dikinase